MAAAPKAEVWPKAEVGAAVEEDPKMLGGAADDAPKALEVVPPPKADPVFPKALGPAVGAPKAEVEAGAEPD